MTALMEELRIAVREIWQSIGFGASANTAATVVPALVLGVALNLIALQVVDRVHPPKERTDIVERVQAEMKFMQTATVSVLRQAGDVSRVRCSVKRWASSLLPEIVYCHIANGLDRAGARNGKRLAIPCKERSSSISARKVLHAI